MTIKSELRKNLATVAARPSWVIVALSAALLLIVLPGLAGAQMTIDPAVSAKLRIGEKITYGVSFGRFAEAGFAELQVVSRGKLDGRDVVELSGRFKTLGLFSTQTLIDEGITSYVSSETGLPLFVRHSSYSSGLAVETTNRPDQGSGSLDILSLIYKIRYAPSGGSATLVRGDRSYSATFQQTGSEVVNVPAGEFSTSVFEVQSELFSEWGLSSVRLNFDNTGDNVPVLIKFKYQDGEFKASANSIQLIRPDPEITPTPLPSETPRPMPSPTATPLPYINDRPLPADLPFVLGEKLEYSIRSGGQSVGRLVLHAGERRLFEGRDSLKLMAQVTAASDPSAGFSVNDRLVAQVDPETLLPWRIDSTFAGGLAAYSLTAIFSPDLGKVSFGNARSVDVPIGTHSILSLFYAIRSFKLAPSTDPNDPVRDTRVAVFWSDKPYVFVVRPMVVELTGPDGEKLDTIQASVTTGDPLLDQLQPRMWVSRDARRLPVRFQLGRFQFHLERTSIELARP